MVRFLSLGGLAGGFLMISPSLRADVVHGYSTVLDTLNDYSPWSYIAIGGAVFIFVTIELYRHALPRKGYRSEYPH